MLITLNINNRDPSTNRVNKYSNIYETVPLKSQTDNLGFQELGNQINSTYFDNIIDHITNLSSFGSRVTGYNLYLPSSSSN
jgi:hypothetical protein